MIKTDAEFLQIALKAYDNPIMCSLSEFESDLKKFTILNTLISRYKDDIGKRERLILNYIVILQNCFDIKSLIPMLHYKVSQDNQQYLATLLVFMKLIDSSDIGINHKLMAVLESL